MRLGKYLSSLTKPELEEILTNANFTEDEEKVFKHIAKGWTINQIQIECNLSESTILRKMDKILNKIEKMKESIEVKREVPIYEKYNLTLDEAAAYFNIGTDRLRELTEENKNELVLMVGTKRLIKRKKMEEYLDRMIVL